MSVPKSTDPMATECLMAIVTAAHAAFSTGLQPLQEVHYTQIHERYQRIMEEMDLLIDDLATAQAASIRRIMRRIERKPKE
ncbi:MAG: hypothetical protein BroJett018_16390 [Chloroflexota bacterium]|nr:hypothetical protein [Chloroflexota bacterium]GIK63845.1 MAG: hypothetical protein BroJett018_16390 [Chloroflexota bacterium]